MSLERFLCEALINISRNSHGAQLGKPVTHFPNFTGEERQTERSCEACLVTQPNPQQDKDLNINLLTPSYLSEHFLSACQAYIHTHTHMRNSYMHTYIHMNLFRNDSLSILADLLPFSPTHSASHSHSSSLSLSLCNWRLPSLPPLPSCTFLPSHSAWPFLTLVRKRDLTRVSEPTEHIREMNQRAAGPPGKVKQASLYALQRAVELMGWLFHLFAEWRGAHPHVALTVLKMINYLVLGSG